MKGFTKRVFLFFLPLLIVVILPSSILWATGECFKSVDSLLESNEDYLIGYAYNNSNRKYLKWKRVVSHPKSRVLAIGSSRVLEFRAEAFEVPFYNAGQVADHLKDIRTFLSIIPPNKYPNHIIIGLDQWWFNENDKLNSNYDSDYWESSFQKIPSVRTYLSVYEDLWEGKYSFDIICKEKKRNVVGLRASVSDMGYRKDGSLDYGKQIEKLLNDDSTAADYKNKNSLKNLANRVGRFVESENVNAKAIEELQELLSFCAEQSIFVSAFLPPYAATVMKEMRKTNSFQYIDKLERTLKPYFDSHKFELFDFSNFASDEEMLDGYHGSELLYFRMLIEMLKKNSKLNLSCKLKRLEQDFLDAINRYEIYKSPK